MPRSPLTETIKHAEGMVHYVQENLSAEEYMLFLDMVDPLPEPVQKPAKKKSSKKSAGKGGGKSKHASSLQQQIQTARPSLDGGVSKMRCAMENCGEYADSNVHHLTTHPVYHEFIPPAEQAAVASGD